MIQICRERETHRHGRAGKGDTLLPKGTGQGRSSSSTTSTAVKLEEERRRTGLLPNDAALSMDILRASLCRKRCRGHE